MNKRTLLIASGIFFVSVAAVLLGAQIYANNNTFRGSLIEPAPPAHAFALQQANGDTYRLADQRGRVVLLFFGYANCPDFCPATLAEFRRAYEDLAEDGLQTEIDFVFITIDPERDDPESIEAFVSSFNPNFVGLSGSEEELQPIWDGYFVFREKQEVGSEAGYLMAHSTRVYAIDKDGNLRLTFPFGQTGEDMSHDVRMLLQE
jgi:protein SCO1/2